MPSTEKLEKVASIRHRIEASQAILLTDYRGLTVADATELRRSLRDSGARFAVVKNTLLKRAADEAGIDTINALLDGPTAVTFVVGDPIDAAKKVVDAARRFPALVLKGAWMEGRVLTAQEAQALASLESREVMLSRVAGLMKSEMSRAASMFQALQSRFVSLLEAYREKLPPGESPAAAGAPVEPAPQAGPDRAAEEEPATSESDTSEEGKE